MKMTRALQIVMKHVGRDPAAVLCEHEDWDATSHDVWVAYHSLHVLKDPAYLKFVTDKLVKHVDRKSALSAATAAGMHRDCDAASPESVVEQLSKLSLDQLDVVGF
jgi:hypothetical protein